MLWFGALYAARVNADHLRALADRERRAVEGPERRRTVSDVVLKHRVGKRIGDAERDVFTDALHAHFAAGRLDRAELDDRLGAVLSGKTLDDLILAVHDLPSERTGR
ncbi:DUF1707 domain-containing protein [Actinomadura sp. KC345]|nr:DUF1707 domain-containing protein [Actinomadura sp. KC345]